MAESVNETCQICLTTNREAIISDSSCYAKVFIQVTAFTNFNKRLWLCMWCKAVLKRATDLFKLALERDKSKDSSNKFNKGVYTLNYIHNTHVDIPPLDVKDVNELNPVDDNIENSTGLEENLIQYDIKIEEEEAPKTNRKSDKFCNSNEEINTTDKHNPNLENEEVNKKSKKQLNLKELDFEVEYLSLEEQLKKVEMKKEKYKDFKFQCMDCGLGFLTNDVFDDHKIKHFEITGPHKCKICTLRFKSQEVLTQHLLAHKRRFRCGLCKATFKRWGHCVAHRYKCGGVVQPTACQQCFKIFNNEHSLKIHMKVHNRTNKYSCDQCGKLLASKQRLTVHMRTHSGIKPFACIRCGRCFTTQSNLRAHLTTHSDETSHYCVECNSYYKTAKSLKRHFNQSARHASSNNEMYPCKECSKQFASDRLLKNHMNAGHGREYRCEHCQKTFSNNSNLNKHVKCIHTK